MMKQDVTVFFLTRMKWNENVLIHKDFLDPSRSVYCKATISQELNS